MKICEHTLEGQVGTAPFSIPPPAFSSLLVCWPAKQFLHVILCNHVVSIMVSSEYVAEYK